MLKSNSLIFLSLVAIICLLTFCDSFNHELSSADKKSIDKKNQDNRKKLFRAGAAAVDVTPTKFPVIINGGMQQRYAKSVRDRLMSRAIVLDDGSTRLAIVVVDSCMIPRKLLDVIKQMASRATGIATDRILISATHTHSAPSSMGCLGSNADTDYVRFLPAQVTRSIVQAVKNLQPAKIGWTVIEDKQHNHCRRWLYRPDRIQRDPFGKQTVRAHLGPSFSTLKDRIAPIGTADPDLSMLALQTPDGKLIALLANYSMHYFGTAPVSADFCGRFGDQFAKQLGKTKTAENFVGIMSQGTSGDSYQADYSKKRRYTNIDQYSQDVAKVAIKGYQQIQYHHWVSLAMAEEKLKLRRRVPNDELLKWAKSITAKLGDQLPKTLAEIYAREQVFLHNEPEVELKLQAIRIGDLGITAIPNEVYNLTGLKIKAQSPLTTTFNIELANGSQGYIPPPEQFHFGGYTTWPARTAGLEVQAEPKIIATVLKLLEKVAQKPRRKIFDPQNQYIKSVLASKPVACWRLGEMIKPQANDTVGKQHGEYEEGVAFFLPGPTGTGLSAGKRGNRAAHFAGGRMKAKVKNLGNTYTVEMWIWNGLPNDARAVTGYFFSRGNDDGKDGDQQAAGDHLGIGGTHQKNAQGKLILFNGNQSNQLLIGSATIKPKTWNHIVLVRDGTNATVYLNGNPKPQISGQIAITRPSNAAEIFIGGRNDRFAPFEGRIDEVAIYNRKLSENEIIAHFKAAGRPANAKTKKSSNDKLKLGSLPRSANESLKAIHIRQGYEVQLVAAEPLVKDPVAIAWGFDGRLWVAEMADYPEGIDGKGKPGGRIRVLQDTNNDGKYDKSTLFLSGLNFPNGIKPWRNGILITAAPQIIFAQDTNGDGVADKQEVLLDGLHEGNQQLRVNGLRYGLDHWIYCASGSHHAGYGAQSQIVSHRANQRVLLGSRDFRFQPDSGKIEPQSGPTQFGRNRDQWGHWFGCMNSYPLWHYVLHDHYTRRNPHFAPPDAKIQLILPRNPKVFPASKPQKRFHSFSNSGRFTSACSAMIYRDNLLFPSDEKRHAFTCEPFHNLVQHNIVLDQGVSFRAKRSEHEKNVDFFASEDRWTRPVMVRTGPDGALWVVDIYRYMIEHPKFLTPQGQEELKPFYRAGEDRGRIYRVIVKGKHLRKIPRLDQMSTAQLVSVFKSSNGVQRDMAQQLLIWRNDKQAIALLKKMATDSQQPLARLHALCTLDAVGSLSAKVLLSALKDKTAEIRRHGVRLSQSIATDHPQLYHELIKLVDDPDAKVRLQLAYSLGHCSGDKSARALAHLAINDGADPYLLAAVMSSVNKDNIATLLKTILVNHKKTGAKISFRRLLELSVSLGSNDATVFALESYLHTTDKSNSETIEKYQTMASFFDTLKRKKKTLKTILLTNSKNNAALNHRIENLLTTAKEDAFNSKQNNAVRVAAVMLLARNVDRREKEIFSMGQLLHPKTAMEVQLAVVKHLSTFADKSIPQIFLKNWKSHGPMLRRRIIEVLTTRKSWLLALLNQVEQGQVKVSDFDASQRQALLTHRDPQIRNRIQKSFALSGSHDRQKIVRKYQAVLKLSGNEQRGVVLFKNKCAVCHQLDGVGHDIGPNLASLTDRKPGSLLNSILDPSASVDGKFITYAAETDDGRIISGILASESSNTITLVSQENKKHTIFRSEIEQLKSTGKSLMPDGLEKELSKQDLADVIQYIRQAIIRSATTTGSK